MNVILFTDTILLLIVVILCFGLLVYEIRSFRKWMEKNVKYDINSLSAHMEKNDECSDEVKRIVRERNNAA
jgi:hypothetical protein